MKKKIFEITLFYHFFQFNQTQTCNGVILHAYNRHIIDMLIECTHLFNDHIVYVVFDFHRPIPFENFNAIFNRKHVFGSFTVHSFLQQLRNEDHIPQIK
jgi:hypothetical protein